MTIDREMRNTQTRKEFVNITYQIICDEGLEGLSIRKIAGRVGCDTALLYRYFGSLDYLIILGSMRLLEEYAKEILVIEQSNTSYIDRCIDSWRVTVDTMFENPPLQYHLFYGCDDELFEDAITEYYQLFPMRPKSLDDLNVGFYLVSLFNGNAFQRNRYYFNRAANENSIRHEDVDYLSMIVSCIASRLLKVHSEDYKQPGVKEYASQMCKHMIEKTIEFCRIDEHEPRVTPPPRAAREGLDPATA